MEDPWADVLASRGDGAELVQELEPAEIKLRPLRASAEACARAQRHRECQQPADKVVGSLLQGRSLAVNDLTLEVEAVDEVEKGA